MAELHARLGEEILALARESAKTGEPIVRSLEYEYPGRAYSSITDQYLLGASILVAPVQEKGATRRAIQFPPGLWKGDDGRRPSTAPAGWK
jgi:alpha-glucosidase (family GH31 glycosyl hydrolase)